MNQKKTIVLHCSPDLEALFMAYCVMTHESIRSSLDIDGIPDVKFIPAGPLRMKDWPGVAKDDLNATYLEERGYLFLDCGGGMLDQHGKPYLFGEKASIDLLIDYVGMSGFEPAHLLPVARVISENDLTGQQIIKDGGMTKSSTPNTPRHLRNAIIGWNILYPNTPLDVLQSASAAFAAIESLAHAKYVRDMAKRNATRERVLANMRVRSCFLMDTICEEAVRTLDAEEAASFVGQVSAALCAMQQDWVQGIRDYCADGTKVHNVMTQRVEAGATISGNLVIVETLSDTIRFGQVSRYRGHEGRSPANVTVQFRSDGRFMVSGDGRFLDEVAAELRKADLQKRGIACSDAELLSRRGHVSVEDGYGGTVQAIYFAEFGKCVGNSFRANPYERVSPLTRDEVMRAVYKGLGVVSLKTRRDPSARAVLDSATAERFATEIKG